MSDKKAGFDIYGDVNVLNKGQIVIPKEVRDRFGIKPGTKLSVLVRGNFIHLVKKEDILPLLNMPKFNLVSESSNETITPIGILENGEIFGLSTKDRIGNMYIIGNAGCGKSVNLINILVSDIMNQRGGILIDPFGDIVKEVLNYVPTELKDNVLEFQCIEGDLKTNIEKLEREIDLLELKKDDKKILLLNLDYRMLGSSVARELGMYIIKRYFNEVNIDSDLHNRSLFIDEAHNFIDEEIMKEIANSKFYGLSCVLLDQTLDNFSMSMAHKMFNIIHHLICYKSSSLTSKFLIDKLHLEISEDHIKNMDKFHFYTALTINNELRSENKARGVFPISYPKA